uniref:Uncharacterized protein n=1 Tax=Oryza brachyantha TaxID=4533 RepID=J3LQ70_ORYBR
MVGKVPASAQQRSETRRGERWLRVDPTVAVCGQRGEGDGNRRVDDGDCLARCGREREWESDSELSQEKSWAGPEKREVGKEGAGETGRVEGVGRQPAGRKEREKEAWAEGGAALRGSLLGQGWQEAARGARERETGKRGKALGGGDRDGAAHGQAGGGNVRHCMGDQGEIAHSREEGSGEVGSSGSGSAEGVGMLVGKGVQEPADDVNGKY